MPEQADSSRPLLDYYWLMDRARYKPVHPLIKKGIRDRLKVVRQAKPDDKSFAVELTDLQDVQTDIPQKQFSVQAQSKNGACTAVATLKLGPADQNRTLSLETISTVTEKGLLPFNRKVKSITVAGTDLATGKPYSRKYDSK
jgi:hypothetical protein